MITTIGRVVDLRRTWLASQQLDRPPLEVLITMDGCTQDMVAAAKAEFPEARLFVNQICLGSVASRDRMMRAARGDLVLALDDDSLSGATGLYRSYRPNIWAAFESCGPFRPQSLFPAFHHCPFGASSSSPWRNGGAGSDAE
jgi:hypothetical protein